MTTIDSAIRDPQFSIADTMPVLKDPLDDLRQAIENKDIEAIKRAYNDITGAIATDGAEDPVGIFLARVKNGLNSDDLDSIERASVNLDEQQASDSEQQPIPVIHPKDKLELDDTSEEFLTIYHDALAEDDTQGARLAFDALAERLQEQGKTDTLYSQWLESLSERIERNNLKTYRPYSNYQVGVFNEEV